VITLQSGAGGTGNAAASPGANAAAVAALQADTIGGGGDNMMAQDVSLMRTEMIGTATFLLVNLWTCH
jgi:hypothetical protein